MKSNIAILLTGAALAAAAWSLSGAHDDPEPPPAAAAHGRAETGNGLADSALQEDLVSTTPLPAGRAPEPRPEAPELLLPDGTTVPALNGTVGAAPLARAWSPHVPYSPIVGIERSDAGVEWYVHADGTRSTTEMKFRPDLGREDAVTRVAHTGPAPPGAKR